MFDSNQNRRRFIKTAGAVGAAGLAGCTDDPDDSTGATGNGGNGSPTELTWLHDRDNGEETINELVDEFNEEHPQIQVEAELLPSGASEAEEIQQRQAAGNPPNILWYTFGQAYRFAREGNLASMNAVVEENDLRTFGTSDDHYFATAIVGPATWHYRQDYFDNPTTFADYLQQAERIDEEEDITPLQFPNGETTLAFSQSHQLLWNGDVNIWEGPADDIQLAMASGEDRQRAVETYEWLQNAYEYASNGNGLGWTDAATAYQEGSAASTPYISMWVPTLYLADKPEIRENTYNGFHPLAQDAQNERKFAWFEGNMIWDTDEEHNDAAREFLQWFHAENQQRRFITANAGDYIPPTSDGMNADWYREEDAVHDEMMDLFASEAENLTPPVATGTDGALNYPAVANSLLWGQATAQLLHGGKSPGETIDWAADQVDL